MQQRHCSHSETDVEAVWWVAGAGGTPKTDAAYQGIHSVIDQCCCLDKVTSVQLTADQVGFIEWLCADTGITSGHVQTPTH